MSMDRTNLRIVAAAILYDEVIYTLPPPARHYDICRMMVEVHGLNADSGCQREQGFLLSNGKYCRRKPAVQIAEEAGQIINKTSPADRLFSEDLW